MKPQTPSVWRSRSGTTLVELMVTIVVLGIIASVAALSIRRQPAPVDDLATAVKTARRTSAEKGLAIRINRVDGGREIELIVHPDGRVVADSGAAVQALTGQTEVKR